MSGEHEELTGPDLARGIAPSDVADGGMVAGHASGKPVPLARRGEELFAIGACARTSSWQRRPAS